MLRSRPQLVPLQSQWKTEFVFQQKVHTEFSVQIKCFFNCHLCFGVRYLHPEGLPSDYTVSVLFRILPETPQEAFALWEILNKANEPLVGLILNSEYCIWRPAVCISVAKKASLSTTPIALSIGNGLLRQCNNIHSQKRKNTVIGSCETDLQFKSLCTFTLTFLFSDGEKTLIFFNYDYKGDFQTVIFEGPDIRKIFYGSFHKVSFFLSFLYYRVLATTLAGNQRNLPLLITGEILIMAKGVL